MTGDELDAAWQTVESRDEMGLTKIERLEIEFEALCGRVTDILDSLKD